MLIMIFSPVLIGYSRDRPAPPPSQYGFTLKIDTKSLPKGIMVREVRDESRVRYFIKNTSDLALIINERFQNDRLISGAKLVSGRVLHYFPNGVPMQGKQHLKVGRHRSEKSMRLCCTSRNPRKYTKIGKLG